jgi:hypothetical protein
MAHPMVVQIQTVRDLTTKIKASRGWSAQTVLQSIKAGSIKHNSRPIQSRLIQVSTSTDIDKSESSVSFGEEPVRCRRQTAVASSASF